MTPSKVYGFTLSRPQLEARRLAAGQDLIDGLPQAEVARRYQVSRPTACRWDRAVHAHGLAGLQARKAPGAEPGLTDAQKELLLEFLLQGARAHGWPTDMWTGKRVSQLIWRRFRVKYHPDYTPRLLHAMGLSWQRSHRSPRERSEEARLEWIQGTWVLSKKNSGREPLSSSPMRPPAP